MDPEKVAGISRAAERCLGNCFYAQLLILELKSAGTSVGLLCLFCVPQPLCFVAVEWSYCVGKTTKTRVL